MARESLRACCAGPATPAPPTKKYCFTMGPFRSPPFLFRSLGAVPLVPTYARPEPSMPQFRVSQMEPSRPVRPGSRPAAATGRPSCGRTPSPATHRSGCRSALSTADRRKCRRHNSSSGRLLPAVWAPASAGSGCSNSVVERVDFDRVDSGSPPFCACMRVPAHTPRARTTAKREENLA